MFIDVNKERIEINFNPYVYVNVWGPEPLYYVELREFPKNESESKLVESFHFNRNVNLMKDNNFYFFGEFYGDYEISVFKFVQNIGLQKIFVHRYNDCGKNVKFNLVSQNYEEVLVWLDCVEKYQQKTGCIINLNSSFPELNLKYPINKGVELYKTYNIGRFEKTSTDFKTIGETRKLDNLWFGNWKFFWSYQHPRKWKNLSSVEIANDILGLSK